MATLSLLPLLLALISPATPAPVELAKIDRSITKEPTYQTHLPKYCLLAFGPDARTRVWLVVDGNELHVDRNGNGDVTEAGERIASSSTGNRLIFTVEDLQLPSADVSKMEVRIRDFDFATGKCKGLMVVVDGQRTHYVGFDEANRFSFAHRPTVAPIVHLDGPLALRLYGEAPTLKGRHDVEVNVAIGTPGLGPGSFCAIHSSTVLKHKVSPIAEIEMPKRDASKPATHLCIVIEDDNRDYFSGYLRVPDDAVNGLAKVTISCPAWKEALVEPLTLELPVVAFPRRHEAEVQGLKSIHSNVETAITFVNASKQKIQVHWLDFHGERQMKRVLKAGETLLSHRTFLSHPWLITDEAGNALQVFLPDAQPRTVEISPTARKGVTP